MHTQLNKYHVYSLLHYRYSHKHHVYRRLVYICTVVSTNMHPMTTSGLLPIVDAPASFETNKPPTQTISAVPLQHIYHNGT